jgi:hypothetical protein
VFQKVQTTLVTETRFFYCYRGKTVIEGCRTVMSYTTVRALQVQLCSEFTVLGHVQ